jgi:hypothetical protein
MIFAGGPVPGVFGPRTAPIGSSPSLPPSSPRRVTAAPAWPTSRKPPASPEASSTTTSRAQNKTKSSPHWTGTRGLRPDPARRRGRWSVRPRGPRNRQGDPQPVQPDPRLGPPRRPVERERDRRSSFRDACPVIRALRRVGFQNLPQPMSRGFRPRARGRSGCRSTRTTSGSTSAAMASVRVKNGGPCPRSARFTTVPPGYEFLDHRHGAGDRLQPKRQRLSVGGRVAGCAPHHVRIVRDRGRRCVEQLDERGGR